MACCPSLWYCTPDGPVEVLPDGSGIYTPPAGWDGSPPQLTEDAALLRCPPSVPTVVTSCGTISETLKVTYGALEFNIVYNYTTFQWYGYGGVTFSCEDGFSVTMWCEDGELFLGLVASFAGPVPPGAVTPSSTSPFLLMYSGPGSICTGTVNFTISEV